MNIRKEKGEGKKRKEKENKNKTSVTYREKVYFSYMVRGHPELPMALPDRSCTLGPTLMKKLLSIYCLPHAKWKGERGRYTSCIKTLLRVAPVTVTQISLAKVFLMIKPFLSMGQRGVWKRILNNTIYQILSCNVQITHFSTRLAHPPTY